MRYRLLGIINLDHRVFFQCFTDHYRCIVNREGSCANKKLQCTIVCVKIKYSNDDVNNLDDVPMVTTTAPTTTKSNKRDDCFRKVRLFYKEGWQATVSSNQQT